MPVDLRKINVWCCRWYGAGGDYDEYLRDHVLSISGLPRRDFGLISERNGRGIRVWWNCRTGEVSGEGADEMAQITGQRDRRDIDGAVLEAFHCEEYAVVDQAAAVNLARYRNSCVGADET